MNGQNVTSNREIVETESSRRVGFRLPDEEPAIEQDSCLAAVVAPDVVLVYRITDKVQRPPITYIPRLASSASSARSFRNSKNWGD